MSRKPCGLLLVFCAILVPQFVQGQVTTATLSGAVKDETGAVLPGVAVVVRNVDTGITRTVMTDEEGYYHAPNLALGNYEVEATLPGFQTAVRRGIKLSVASEAAVAVVLKVGEITERVVVTGEAPLVDTKTSAIFGLVDDKVIRDLPLNGRSFTQLATLQPGVTVSYYAGTGDVESGRLGAGKGQKYSIAGARPQHSSFLMDGTDVNDTYNNTPGSVAGVFLGVEAVREFKVLTSTFSADTGRSAGGVITIVTKSGTNDLHGSIFEFHRNSALDAKNFFDQIGKPIPPFKRNQFGFALGGPLKKNRTFFFGTFEALRDRLGFSRLATVPAAIVHRGLLPDPQTGGLAPIAIHPAIKPYLDLYPLPNGRDFGGGTAELVGSGSRPLDEDFFVARVDHQLSDKDSLFVRYTFDNGVFRKGQPLPLFENVRRNRNQYVTLEETRIFTPDLLSSFRFGFNRSFAHEFIETIGIPRSLDLSPVLPFGTSGGITPGSGLTPLSGETVAPTQVAYNLFEWSDDVNYSRGRHSIKSGLLIKRIRFNIFQWFNGSGTLSFASLANFLRGDPSRFVAVGPGSDPTKAWRHTYVGAFLQDDFRVNDKLTLNLGLRYEVLTGPVEATGRVANYDDDLGLRFRLGNPYFPTVSKKGFQPRFGFAWDPSGHGKTAVRGGFGIFHDQPLPSTYHTQGYLIQPFFFQVAVSNPPFPGAFEYVSTISPIFSPDSTSYTKIPYTMQYNLALSREMGAGTVLTIGYAGSRGVSLQGGRDYNALRVPQILPDGTKFYPRNAPLLITHLDRFRRSTSDRSSWYNAMLLALRKRLRHGFQFQVSHTYGGSIDNGSQFNASETRNSDSTALDPFDLRREKSLSSFHIKHSFSANYVYDLPFGPGRSLGRDVSGALAKLVGGWQMGGILSIASGPPFSLSGGNCRCDRTGREGGRANLVPGRSNNPVLGGPDQYFDPNAFEPPPVGFLGNLGRNTVLGPGVATFDFSVVKNTSVRENQNVQFKVEFFNLFNRPNFGMPERAIFTGGGVRVGSAGRIRNTTTTSRQIQLGLKVIF